MLEINLFGSPQIILDGQPMRIERRKSRAMLFYLAAHSQPQKREHLLAVFWPDSPRPAAQQVLRTTLHGLRKSLGPALRVDADEIALSPGTRVDAREFEQALAAPPAGPRSLDDALDLYRGDFLENFSLPDAQEFEDWASIEREHFHRLAVRGLSALSNLYESSQNYTAALAALDRALAFNPLQEDLQRETIRLQFLAGDRPGAIRRYDELRKLLDEKMGVPPMAETRSLYDAILSDRLDASLTLSNRPAAAQRRTPPAPALQAQAPPASARASRSPSLLPFRGREAEMQTLSGLAERRQLVLVEGEPGIGKTRLVDEFLSARQAL
ncbi:MAG TPA: BTAD domain-containing putative transcriptional regulator, partial [Anaerolineales bacterium]